MTEATAGPAERPGWKGTVLLAAFAFVVAVGLCELVVRLLLPMPPAFSWLRRDGLVLHAPGMRATYFRQEYRTEVAINSLGLRGPEIQAAKSPGTLRVLVLGDSYAEGLQVPWEDLLSTRLERALNDGPGPRVEVVNGGVSGYGTADELLLLEKLGWRLQPDLVLVAFCIHNDVANNLDRPLYDFSKRPPRRVEAPPPSRRALAMVRFKEFLSRHSQLYQLVRDRTAGLRGEDLTQKLGVRRRSGNVPAQGGPVARGLDYTSWFVDAPPAELARGLDYTRELLGRIQEEGRGHGARVLAVWIPIRDQVSDKRWESLRQKLALRPESRSRPQEELAKMAGALGLDAVDLLPAFRASPAQETLYFDVDGHWTSAGHALAAEMLLPELRAWRNQEALRLAAGRAALQSVPTLYPPEGRSASGPRTASR
jgi:lysophospholipase L1-like esterase